MEKDESVVKEFRLGDVSVQLGRYEAADGRTWPTFRLGRYYVKDKQERFTAGLRVDDLPVAAEELVQAFLWAKANPQAVRNGAEE